MQAIPPAKVTTLTFRLFGAKNEKVVCPYRTPWRSLPCLMFNQWSTPLELEVEGKNSILVPADYGVLLPSGVRHRLGPQTKNGEINCRWIHIQYLWMGVTDPFMHRSLPNVIKPSTANRIAKICSQLDCSRSDFQTVTNHHFEVFRFLKILNSLAGTIRNEPEGNLAFISPALHFIEENLGIPFSRAELAQSMHLSEGRFHDVFSRAVGVAPMLYVAQRRFQHAQGLLATTDIAVTDIAKSCGFRDSFHFSRRFKTYCGMSPSQYRISVTLAPVSATRETCDEIQ